MAVKVEQLEDIFTYHAPETAEQLQAYDKIRRAGKALAQAILEGTPICGDQQAAVRKVREAVMTANAAVALKGMV